MTTRPARWMLAVAACAAVVLAATAAPAAALTNEVKLDSYAFDPPIRRISLGTSIRFRGHATVTHTATSADGLWDSGALADGQTYTVTFNAPGAYRYFCRFHSQMTGTIFVETLSSAPAASPVSTEVAASPVGVAPAAAGAGGAGGGPAGAASGSSPPAPSPSAEPAAPRTLAPVAAVEPASEAPRAPSRSERPAPPAWALAVPAVLALAGLGLIAWEAVDRARRGY